ncbi:MAG: SDR family NAD(P)-dependent oxidoreductase [Anaerolineae bacterium]
MARRVALITGSTKGIGLGIARRLAQDGMGIVLNYRADRAAAREALRGIRELVTEATAFQADVSVPEEAEGLIAKTVEQFGRLDVLVNNVGPFLVKPIFDTTIEEWRTIIDSNLSSTFYCIKYALPVMREQGGGNIINIGSLNCELAKGAPTTTAYNVTKTAIVVLTKSVARGEAAYNIRANMVNPGFIETYAYSEEQKESMVKDIPLGYLGQPSDVAEAVSFLVSDRARYITGAVLNVHGGLWV